MNTICEHCQAKNSIIEEYTTGEVVCTNCGTVYDDHLISDVYGKGALECNKNKTIGTPETHEQDTEPGTFLTVTKNGKTKVVGEHQKETKEQKYCKKIQHFLSNADITDNLITKTQELYIMMAPYKNMQGRNFNHIILALYYYASRVEGVALSFREIANRFSSIKEKQIRKELKRFENTLPCLLKANSEGKISAFNSCFEDIPLDKIQFREENELSAEEIISNSNETIVDNKEISLGISILMNDVEFKLKTDKDYKYSTSSKSILVKKKIYSSSIKENDIIINDIYYNRLLEIAEDDNSNDEQKAQQLDQIFKDTGFYVPLKVYIGGLYNMDCRDMSNEQKRNFLSN